MHTNYAKTFNLIFVKLISYTGILNSNQTGSHVSKYRSYCNKKSSLLINIEKDFSLWRQLK